MADPSPSQPVSVPSESAHGDVTVRNRQIFRRYAKTFANLADPALPEVAAKFADWLSNPRGYYEAARPEIVKLLMIMHNALRKAVDYPETQQVPLPPDAYIQLPISQLYIQLVTTVHRFASLFTEPNLQSLLKGLFFSVNLPYAPSVGAVQGQVPLISPSPVGTLPPAPTISPPQHTPHPAQSIEAVDPNQPALHHASSNPVKTEAGQRSAPTLQPGNDNISIPSSGSPVGDPGSGARVKKRKRKTLDLESLAEMDLKNYIEKQERAQVQGHSSSSGLPVVSEDLSATGPPVSGESQHPHSEYVQQQPLPEVTSVTLNRPLPEVAEILDSPQVPPAPVVVKSEPADQVIPRATLSPLPPSEPIVIDLTLADDEPPTNTDAMQVDEEREQPVALVPSTEGLERPSSMDIEKLPLPSHSEVQASQTITIDELNKDDEVNMEVDTRGVMPTAEPDHLGVADLDEHTTIRENISIIGEAFVEVLSHNKAEGISPMANVTEAQNTVMGEKAMNGVRKEGEGEHGDEQKEEPVAPISLPMANEKIYGVEMKVVAFQRGLKSNSRVRFTFDVGEDHLESILAWSRHDAPIAKLRSSLCISLGCYPVSQVKLSEPIAPQIRLLQSSWPGEGGLTMKFTYNSEMQSFPLSPPLLISPDNTVDLSMFVQLGHNCFEISQNRNWSEHVFILLAHYPTGKQIQNLEAKKEEEEAWMNWLEEMAKPIVVKFPPADFRGILEPDRKEPRRISVSNEG